MKNCDEFQSIFGVGAAGAGGGELDSSQESLFDDAKIFFNPKDFKEMGKSANIILQKVARDKLIRRNLKEHVSNRLSLELMSFELASEMTNEQLVRRN